MNTPVTVPARWAERAQNLVSIKHLSIFAKVLLVVSLTSLVTVVVAATGYLGINSLTHAINEIKVSGAQALAASRVTQLALELNRSEFILSADPTPDNLRETEKRIAQQNDALAVAFSDLKAQFKGQNADLLEALDAAQKSYLKAQEGTIDKVRTLGSKVEVSEEQMIITDAAMTSSTVAGKLESSAASLSVAAKNQAEIAQANATRTQDMVNMTMIAVALVGVLGGLSLGVVIAHLGIGKPLARSVDDIERLSQGNAEIDVFGLERRDEIGTIAKALQVFKRNIQDKQRMEFEAREASQRAEQEKVKTMHGLADMLDQAVQGVVSAISSAATDMHTNARALSTMSDHTLAQATEVMNAAGEASTNVEQVASAAEQMAQTIGLISSQVTEACQVSAQAVGQASHADEVMEGLTTTAEQIGEVVSLIADIAGMTNLLALNATIEAARAGDAGKGFAVVAGEVKNLANQTARATEDIRRHVVSVQSMTGEIGQAISNIVDTIGSINHLANRISTAMDEQGTATRSIAASIEQAASGTSLVASNIALVRQEAEQVGGASGHVLDASQNLTSQAEILRQAVDGFTGQIRSA